MKKVLGMSVAMLMMLNASETMAQKYHAAALEGVVGKVKQIDIYRNDTLKATYFYSKDGRLLTENGEIDTNVSYGSGGYPSMQKVTGEGGEYTFKYEWEKKNKTKRLVRATMSGGGKADEVKDYVYDASAEEMGLNICNGYRMWDGITKRAESDGECVYTYSSPDFSGNVVHRRSTGKSPAQLNAYEWDAVERIEIAYYKEPDAKDNTEFVYNMPKDDSKEDRTRFKEKLYTNLYVPYDKDAIAKARLLDKGHQTSQEAYVKENNNMTSVDRFPMMYNMGEKAKWNTPKWRKRTLGIGAGYVQKQWKRTPTDGGETVKGGMLKYKDGSPMNDYAQGIQAGLKIEPQFAFGIGLKSGVFFEGFAEKSKTEEGMYKTTTEFGVHIPLHLEYRANINKWLQVFAFGGVAYEYILSGNVKHYEVGVSEKLQEDKIVYKKENDLMRYNLSAEFGFGIQCLGLQLQWKMANGLVDMSGSDKYKVKQCKPMTASIAWMF